MTRFEILIELNGVRYQLDTYKEEPISLTYNVADISDIASRNSSFSKTIRLPETRNNRQIFGDISDLGVDSSFNPNLKTKAFILVDTVLIFEGYLQLRKVFVDKDIDKVDYEVVIYAENDNFFKQLGDLYLTDLDFTELNHFYTKSEIMNSWKYTWNKGYYYPLIDYGKDWDMGNINGYSGEVKISDMFASTNVKYILNKIFNSIGYTYESNFFDTDVFESLYIPFNREKIKRDITLSPDRFTVGMTMSSLQQTTTDITIPKQLNGTNPSIQVVDLGKWRIPFNDENSPNGDPDDVYNTTTYEYTAPTDFIAERFVCNFDIEFEMVDSLTDYNLAGTNIKFMRSRNPATGVTVSGGVSVPINGLTYGKRFLASTIPGIQYDNNFKRVTGQVSTDILNNSTTNTTKLYPGEKLWVEVSFALKNNEIKDWYSNSSNNFNTNIAEPYWGAISDTHAVYDTRDPFQYKQDLYVVDLSNGVSGLIANNLNVFSKYDTDGDYVVFEDNALKRLVLHRISTGVQTTIDTYTTGFGWDFIGIENSVVIYYNVENSNRRISRYDISTGTTTVILSTATFGFLTDSIRYNGDYACFYNVDNDNFYVYKVSTGTLTVMYNYPTQPSKVGLFGDYVCWWQQGTSVIKRYKISTLTLSDVVTGVNSIGAYSMDDTHYCYLDFTAGPSYKKVKHINLSTGTVTSVTGTFNVQSNSLSNYGSDMLFHDIDGNKWYYYNGATTTQIDTDTGSSGVAKMNQFGAAVYLNRQTGILKEYNTSTGAFTTITSNVTNFASNYAFLTNSNGVYLFSIIDYPNDSVIVWVPNQGAVPGDNFAWTLPSGTDVLTFNAPNLFFNILEELVLPNEELTYNQLIPEKFKQKDFIVSLIRMFNLYIEPSKDYEKHLIIEPRDDYYASGAIKDWTGKLDINDEIEEQILGETQNKTTIFKYKDDKDYYNVDYKDTKAGFSYGEFQYIMDNDFINGVKKIENSFSPTPLISIPNSNQFVIPKIGKINNNLFAPTQHNVRILTKFNSSTDNSWTYNDYIWYSSGGFYNAYIALTTDSAYGPFTNATHNFSVGDYININQSDGGALKPMLQGDFKIVEVVDNKTIVINITFAQVGSGPAITGVATPIDGLLPTVDDWDTWKFEGEALKAYPYLGHFDNPQSPHYDLNYGQTVGLYYEETTVTNDNLYSVYWQNFINELSDKDSRIITATFYLTPDDIANFRFNDNIYINDQYFKVNKIQNYNPAEETTCKVELIKTKYITVPRRFSRTKPNWPVLPPVIDGPVRPVLPPIKPGKPIGVLTTNSTNVIEKADSGVIGRNNFVYSSKSLTVGDNNTVSGEKAIVFGDNNIVAENKSFIFGDNNVVEPGAEGSVIFGDNTTVSEPGTFVISGKLSIVSNYVNAGRNEILNAFPDNKLINYVSASRNEVRELGSQDVINIISGGRYTE